MVVVESHHHVLPHWAKYRSRLQRAPILLTLDHHTDTSPAFRKHLSNYTKGSVEFLNQQNELLSTMNFKNLTSVENAVQKLAHDEHITAALKADIISGAFVIAQNAIDTDRNTFAEHKICCFSALRETSRNAFESYEQDRLLEADFLQNAFKHFCKVSPFFSSTDIFLKQDYILDIDLDYLNTFKVVEPKDASFIKEIANHAGLITVAKEPRHVSMCALEEGLTADYLLQKLQQLLIMPSIIAQ
jgi:hypothetical protein